jgi:hypothetical protein
MPGLGATIDALSGWAVRREGVVCTSRGELTHTGAQAAGPGAGQHPAFRGPPTFRRRVAQTGHEHQPLPLARR